MPPQHTIPFHAAARPDPGLAGAARFLRVENAALRWRLPGRVNLTPRERDRLFEPGGSLGAAVAAEFDRYHGVDRRDGEQDIAQGAGDELLRRVVGRIHRKGMP